MEKMIIALFKLIKRKRQIMTEITTKQDEMVEVDRLIEAEVLHLVRKKAERGSPDFSMFKDETERLLTAFCGVYNRMLSQEDIRQDVILDEDASDGAVRHVINRANKALQEANMPYVIRIFGVRATGLRTRICPKVSRNNQKHGTRRRKKSRKYRILRNIYLIQ